MGKIKQGAFGGFTGKVGNLVGCTWKGIPYMRTRPANMTNPRTEKQQGQRSKFQVALNFLRTITPFLRIGYREFAERQTAFNAAMSYVMKNTLADSEQGLVIDYNKVLVSHGSLTQASNATVSTEDSKALFTWEDNSEQGNAMTTDAAMLLVYNKEKTVAVYDTSAAMRSDGNAELELPKDWKDDTLIAYLGFCSANDKSVANSICLPITAS